jgi:hypothetical protein
MFKIIKIKIRISLLQIGLLLIIIGLLNKLINNKTFKETVLSKW